MQTKEELKRKLEKIEEEEKKAKREKAKREKEKEENFERWKRRSSDYIIGLAHASIDDLGKRYTSDEFQNMIPVGVSISGNMGHTYYPIAKMTSSSKTYMHNVWQEKDKQEFQQELNDLVAKHVNKSCWSLKARLEMMGLQSNSWILHRTDTFPENKIETIERAIKTAQDEILDTYKDKDFEALFRTDFWEDDDGVSHQKTRDTLSHSSSICQRYLKKKRPKLYKKLYAKKLT